MKRKLTDHSLMQGTLRSMELQAIEFEQNTAEAGRNRSLMRTHAIDLHSRHRSFYIRRRLEGLLSALDGLDELQRQEEKLHHSLQKYLQRLQNSDLLDHFGRGLHRRANRMLRKSMDAMAEKRAGKQQSVPAEWKGERWFLLEIGSLSLALRGRLVRYQNLRRPIRILSENYSIRIFPESDHLFTDHRPRRLAIFQTSINERSAIYCNRLSVLPELFRPEELTAASHPYLLGRMKYGGRTVYIWDGLRGDPGSGRDALS